MSGFSERCARLTAQLGEHGADAALVSGLPNIRYLAGFTGSNALLLLTRDSATLFTDPRYAIQASAETGCKVVIAKRPLLPAVIGLLGRKRIRRLGIEPARMHVDTMMELEKQAKKLTCVAMPPLAERLRMIKGPAEIDAIRRSALTNSRAYARALKHVKPTASENGIAAEIEYQQRRLGAEGFAFESIVAAGPRSALPHARPTTEPIGSGRLLLIDIGAVQSGYCSDMTRVVHLGTPSTKAKKLYRAVLESQLAAIDFVRPGVTAGKVDRVARSVLEQHGLLKNFVHSTGHGLGLEIHETPRLGRNDKTRLEAGMVVTIEPGAYQEGFGGVRIEDTVLVTPGGCEILTQVPKELLVV